MCHPGWARARTEAYREARRPADDGRPTPPPRGAGPDGGGARPAVPAPAPPAPAAGEPVGAPVAEGAG